MSPSGVRNPLTNSVHHQLSEGSYSLSSQPLTAHAVETNLFVLRTASFVLLDSFDRSSLWRFSAVRCLGELFNAALHPERYWRRGPRSQKVGARVGGGGGGDGGGAGEVGRGEGGGELDLTLRGHQRHRR